jgi:hypothetical protein
MDGCEVELHQNPKLAAEHAEYFQKHAETLKALLDRLPHERSYAEICRYELSVRTSLIHNTEHDSLI